MSKDIKSNKDLEVWKKSMDLVSEIYKVTEAFPNKEIYGLTNQIRRAAVSIPSNIAEGTSRSSNKDFKRFLEIALGSAFEIETQLYCIQYLNLINEDSIDDILLLLNEEQKMINSYIIRISR